MDKKEWSKEYYQKYKEEIKEHSKKYRINHPKYLKEYYQENKDKISKQFKEYRGRNKEKISRQLREWQENNKEYISKYNKEYKKNNREKSDRQHKIWNKTEKGKANSQRGHIARKTRLKEVINTLTAEEWLNILKQNNFKCAYCGKDLITLFDRPTRDHIIPISKSGNNIKENIFPLADLVMPKKEIKYYKEKEVK